MSTTTALSTLNFGLAGLWDYVYTTLTSGGLIYIVIAFAVLFGALALGKKLLHSRV